MPSKLTARHAVHVGRQDEAVPVDRGALAQVVSDAHRDRVALAHAQQRRGHLAVDGHGAPRSAGVVHRQFVDREIEVGAGELRRARSPAASARPRPCASSSAPPARPCTNRRRSNGLKLSMSCAPILADSRGMYRASWIFPVLFLCLAPATFRRQAGLRIATLRSGRRRPRARVAASSMCPRIDARRHGRKIASSCGGAAGHRRRA